MALGSILKPIIAWEGTSDPGLEYDCRSLAMARPRTFGRTHGLTHCCFRVSLSSSIPRYRCCFHLNSRLHGAKCLGGPSRSSVTGHNSFRMEREPMSLFCVVCSDFTFGSCLKSCDVVIPLVKNTPNLIKTNQNKYDYTGENNDPRILGCMYNHRTLTDHRGGPRQV